MKIANYEIEVKKDGTLNYNGYLDLRGTSITSLPDNLTVGGSLDLRGTSITSLPDNLTVGGSLDLRGTSITSLPDNLTVGGSLYLEGTSITSLPDNLTVGGSLYLEGTSITSLPDNLTVGGSLDLEGTSITNTSRINKNAPEILFWKNGKYVLVDGIFAEVIRKRNGVFKLKKPNSSKVFFCVTDGNGRYAHGDTVQAAKDDLLYKISSDDRREQYKDIALDSILTFEECIRFYRVMTGACAFGVKNFIESNNIKRRSYTVREILTITKGQYGSDSLAFLREASK